MNNCDYNIYDFWGCCNSIDLSHYATDSDIEKIWDAMEDIAVSAECQCDLTEVESQLQALQGAIVSIDDTLPTKADLSALTATNDRVTALENAEPVTPDLSNYYTKTEVDGKIEVPEVTETSPTNSYVFEDDSVASITVTLSNKVKRDTVSIEGEVNGEPFSDTITVYLVGNPYTIESGNEMGFGSIVDNKLVITVPNGHISSFDGGEYGTIDVPYVAYTSGTPSTVIPQIEQDILGMRDGMVDVTNTATQARTTASQAYTTANKGITAITIPTSAESGYTVSIKGTNATGGTSSANISLSSPLYTSNGRRIEIDREGLRSYLKNGSMGFFYFDGSTGHRLTPFETGTTLYFARINGQPVVSESGSTDINITGTVDTALIAQMQSQIAALEARVAELEDCCSGGGGDTGDTPTPDTGTTAITDAALITLSNGTSRTIAYTGTGREFINEIQTFPSGEDRSLVTSVVIGDRVWGLGVDAFSNCTNLTAVTLPEGFESLGVDTFKNCTSLTSITLPSTVTSIAPSTFSGCTGLGVMTLLPTTPPRVAESNYSDAFANAHTIYVPSEALTAYQTAWPDIASKIQSI